MTYYKVFESERIILSVDEIINEIRLLIDNQKIFYSPQGEKRVIKEVDGKVLILDCDNIQKNLFLIKNIKIYLQKNDSKVCRKINLTLAKIPQLSIIYVFILMELIGIAKIEGKGLKGDPYWFLFF